MTDAAARAADRETCSGVTSLSTALTRGGLTGEAAVTGAVSGPWARDVRAVRSSEGTLPAV